MELMREISSVRAACNHDRRSVYLEGNSPDSRGWVRGNLASTRLAMVTPSSRFTMLPIARMLGADC